MDKTNFLEFAKSLALGAGKIVKEGYYSEICVEKKSELDFVTQTDKDSEKFLREEIRKAFPEHGFLGEETGRAVANRTAEYVWVVDPLDGTTNFVHKIPFFAVSIVLRRKDEVLLGVVYNPMTDEMFYAEKGKGAYLKCRNLKEKRIEVKKPKPLEKWFLAFCFRDHMRLEEAESIIRDTFYPNVMRLEKLGSAALELCYAADNRVSAYIGLTLSEWDYAAGELIVKESGGVVLHGRLINKDVVVAGEKNAVSLIASRIFHHNEFLDRHDTG